MLEKPSPVLTPEQIEQVTARLGRSPRGLEAIAVADEQGAPQVIRVASLVDDKPFPTLYWLIDPDLCYRIDQVEATGLIAELQQRIDDSEALRAAMVEDHQRHIAHRDAFMVDQVRERIAALGYASVFREKGIGGISDFSRIRCLHTWYAAHLVENNTVGTLLDRHWSQAA